MGLAPIQLPQQSQWSKDQAPLFEKLVAHMLAHLNTNEPVRATPTFGAIEGGEWSGVFLTRSSGEAIGIVHINKSEPGKLVIGNNAPKEFDDALKAAWSDLNPTTED